MKDIFQDTKFNDFLYGGVHDLDEDIGMLVYKMYQMHLKGFVTSSWSCSGHIGPQLLDAGKSSRADYFVFVDGCLYFKPATANPLVDKYDAEMKAVLAGYQFASHRVLKDETGDKTVFDLTFEDLVEKPEITPGTTAVTSSIRKSGLRGGVGLLRYEFQLPEPKKEIKIELATERYELFKEVWKKLDAITETYLKML